MGFNLFGTVEKDIGQLSGKVGHVVGDTLGWVEQQWTQRIVQISVFSALLFFVLSSFDLINAVDKALTNALGVKVGKDWTRALHAATFGVFMYVGVRFILDNLIKQIINGTVVEGNLGDAETVEKGGGEDSNNALDDCQKKLIDRQTLTGRTLTMIQENICRAAAAGVPLMEGPQGSCVPA